MVAFSLGIIIGPAFGGLYIKWTGDTSSALIVSASAYAALAVYCIVLPESLPAVARRSVTENVVVNESPTIMTRLKQVITKLLIHFSCFYQEESMNLLLLLNHRDETLCS